MIKVLVGPVSGWRTAALSLRAHGAFAGSAHTEDTELWRLFLFLHGQSYQITFPLLRPPLTLIINTSLKTLSPKIVTLEVRASTHEIRRTLGTRRPAGSGAARRAGCQAGCKLVPGLSSGRFLPIPSL